MVESTSASSHLWPTCGAKREAKARWTYTYPLRAKHRWHPCKLYLKSHILIFFANPRNFSGPHLNTGVCSHVRRALPSGGQMNVFAYCRSKPYCESAGYEQALANPRAAVAPWITTRRTSSAEQALWGRSTEPKRALLGHRSPKYPLVPLHD